MQSPPKALRQKCPPPVVVPASSGRDLVSNSNNRQSAYDGCNVRHQCLLDYLDEADRIAKVGGSAVPTPITCGSLIEAVQ